MHAQFLNKFSLAANAIQVANQQNPQQQFWIDRRTTRLAIAVLQSLAHNTARDDSLRSDLPVGSSRTAIQSARADPS
jgi:hypothetical protein